MDAIDFLIERRILVSRDLESKWNLNLSRDCYIKTVKDIVQAMEDYAEKREEEVKDRHDYSV